MLAVTPSTYEQLGEDALALLRDAVKQRRSIAAVAHALGYSRSAISMALAGKYVGGTARLRARILEVLVHQVQCPHLGEPIAPSACRDLRERPMSTANRDAIKQWQACRMCAHGCGAGGGNES
ncbi:hypothetical protein V5G24_00080 [Xanthobacter sp. VTT E-85241]|uniref:hypothetical protein n=1 Tax=Roseixanthobacter finlandensis TaxID=3119922 RepID=UPI00372C914F